MAQPAGSLAPRHQLIGWMLAVGRKPREITETLGISEKTVQVVMGSPLFQAFVRQTQAEIKERLLADVIEKLSAEAMPTLERLIALRDQGRDLKVALGASRELFARHVPAKVHVEEERTLRVLLAEDVEPLLEAMAEARGERYVRPARAIAAGAEPVEADDADFLDGDDVEAAAAAADPKPAPRRPGRIIPGDVPFDPGPYDHFDSDDD
jgi:hypothetical protein